MAEKQSKLDQTISALKKELERNRRKGYSHSTVRNPELAALLEWAEKVREKNPILVGAERKWN